MYEPGPGISKDVVCPFCGLLCDDLTVNRENERIAVDANGCQLTQRRFLEAASRVDLQPRICGQVATRGAALQAAADLISHANLPAIAGMMTDVAGCRSALRLAKRIRASIDQHASRSSALNTSRIQTHGGFFITLTEARNSADLLVLINPDLITRFPRLLEILNFDKTSESRLKQRRNVAVLGESSDKVRTQDNIAAHVECQLEDAGLVASIVQRRLEKSVHSASHHHDVSQTQIDQLISLIEQSHYPVFVWAGEDFVFPLGDLVIESVFRLIETLNKSKRAAGLTLTSSASTVTANTVSTWLHGNPLPISFRKGSPEYQPEYYSLQSIVSRGDTDLVIWVGGLEEKIELPDTDVRTIVLSNVEPENSDVFLPVAMPGIDHDAHLFRSDWVVARYLQGLRVMNGHSSAETLQEIQGMLNC